MGAWRKLAFRALMAWFLLGGTAFAVKMSGSANGLAKVGLACWVLCG